MSCISLQADFESHHKVNVNDKEIEISFRYFSPHQHHKIRTSLSPQESDNGSKSRLRKRSADKLSIQNDREVERKRERQKEKESLQRENKVERNPFVASKRFYEDNLSEVRDSALENYENFERKLMLMGKETNKKSLRLRITLKQKKERVQEKGRHPHPNSYIKKVRINLKNRQQGEQPFKEVSNYQRHLQSVQQEASSKRKSFLTPKQKQNTPSRNLQRSRNSNLIKIKLFEDESYQNRQVNSDIKNNAFETPNRKNNSSKRGISVCSSTSSQNKSRNRCLSKTFNTSAVVRSSIISKKSLQTLPNQNQSFGRTTIKLFGTNQKERKAESSQKRQTEDFSSPLKMSQKSRIYSKSRIERKNSPIKEPTTNLIKE